MTQSTKRIVVLSASPKAGRDSTSEFLAQLGGDAMQSPDLEITQINVRDSLRKQHTEQDFSAMLRADAMIMIFPLYFFCLPGMLMQFLQDYFAYFTQHRAQATRANIYAVINCGFPEPGINTEAAQVLESFSRKTGNAYRFSLLIGGGGMLGGAKDAPFMRETIDALRDAFRSMRSDVIAPHAAPAKDLRVSMKFPRRLYFWMGTLGWYSAARKNGIKRKDLYRKPYRSQ